MDSGINFGEFDEGRGVNYWELNRALQRELEQELSSETMEVNVTLGARTENSQKK